MRWTVCTSNGVLGGEIDGAMKRTQRYGVNGDKKGKENGRGS